MVWYRSLDGLMQVLGCFDAGPRISDAAMQVPEVQIFETETLSGKEGPLLGKSMLPAEYEYAVNYPASQKFSVLSEPSL